MAYVRRILKHDDGRLAVLEFLYYTDDFIKKLASRVVESFPVACLREALTWETSMQDIYRL